MTARFQPTQKNRDSQHANHQGMDLVGRRETVTHIQSLRLNRGIGRGVQTVSVCHFEGPCRDKHLKNNSVTTLMTCLWNGTCNQKETMTIQEAVRRYGKHKR